MINVNFIKKMGNKELESCIIMLQEEIDVRKEVIDKCIYNLNNRGVEYKCLFLMPDGRAKFHLVSGYSNTRILGSPSSCAGSNIGLGLPMDPIWEVYFTLIEVIDDIYVYEQGGGRLRRVKYFNRR